MVSYSAYQKMSLQKGIKELTYDFKGLMSDASSSKDKGVQPQSQSRHGTYLNMIGLSKL